MSPDRIQSMTASALLYRALWFFPLYLAVTEAWQATPRGLARIALAAGIALAVFLLRRWPLLSGPLLASIGIHLGSDSVFQYTVRQDARAIAGIVAAILFAVAGVRMTVAHERFPMRLLEAVTGFLIPIVVWRLSQVRGFGGRGFPLLLAADLAPVALLACFGRGWGRVLEPSRRMLAIPALLTAVVAAGSSLRQSQQMRAREDRLAAQVARVPKVEPPAAYDRVFFQRGVSFVGDGPDAYFPEPSARLLDELRTYGVDSIALIPYGGGTPDGGEIRFDPRRASPSRYEALGHLARARKMRILLKPQIWAGGFPGNIDVPDPERRRKWFASYTVFIEEWARIATRIHADLFCVGTEFVKMSRHEAEWRQIIARVRELYQGPIVYAATQGEEFETLRFWDALDYIGLDNYYPLPDNLDTSELITKVETVRKRFDKPVLLTEAGFASVENPNREPWSEPRRKISLEDQARCYEALFRAFYGKPWFHGFYWWKVSTDGRGGPQDRSLTPWRKPAMEVVGRWYRQPRPGIQMR